ncbi:hypothetical protein V5740_14025 (plasmid) [Croceibacterium sp. TMG7-5b_MA50]|uniref:hypothetical protein n=1 Tax=Croceibacterium sp. TMG7-5b_MA50 TaxID=3121290 RepID=UPI003221C18B
MPDLTLGCLFSDRVEALADGRVVPDGCRLTVRFAEAQALFRSVLRGDGTDDLAELSLGSHIAAVAAGRREWLGLPVFPSRAFRHANLYVRADRIRRPEDLAGRRIGLLDYQQTAALWLRGLLADDHGVARESVRWITGGLHAPVLTDRAPGPAPAGLSIVRTPETLDVLLVAGEIDAIISPTAPNCWRDGTAPVARMWPDHPAAEAAWWQRTGLFPIMHLIVLRRSLAEAHPGLAAPLCTAFTAALELALADVARRDFPKIAVPGQLAAAESALATFGPGLWTYGLERNRPVLAAALRHACADGLAGPGLTPDDLFQ